MKTILITGASRRLGLYLCEKFLKQGDEVIALTRKPSSELAALKSEHSLHIFTVKEYSEENLKLALDEIKKQFTKIDALIHNASAFSKNYDFSQAQFQEFFQLHMAMPAQINESLKNCLFSQSLPGLIVHMTDIYVDNPNQEFVLYCATKAGLENMTKGFAKKFAPGVRVISIQPGPIQFLENHKDTEKEKILSETLLDSEGGFEPIFLTVKYAIDNTYLTGSSIKVDGGRALGRR